MSAIHVATVTKRRKKETDAHITIVPNPHGADAAPTGCRPVRSPDLRRCLTSKHVVKHETGGVRDLPIQGLGSQQEPAEMTADP
jgi:hypothetical protein